MADYSQVPPRSPAPPDSDAPFNPYNIPETQRAQATGDASPPSPTPGTPAVEPYLDDLRPPMGGFHANDLNRASLASGAPSSFNRMSSGWNSRASLQEERGLLPTAAAGAAVGAGTGAAAFKNEPDSGYNPAAHSAEAGETKRRRRPWLIPAIIAAVVLIAAAIGLGVYFGAVKPKKSSGNGDGNGDGGDVDKPPTDDGSNGNSTDTPPPPAVILTGTDGSEVEMEDGTKFIYNNSFSGFWYYDKENPLSGPAGQANSWTRPVNESWRWGIDKQLGVNLGGWLVLEPFISPAVFEKYYPDAVDEFTLVPLMEADTANGGTKQLEDHYKTFITEQDFANIAAAGLNWIRLPVPFWAVSKMPDEPFLEHVAWTYFVKAIVWARKYGLRINLDLHSLPGSQNGWNHSGKLGEINWMRGVMGIANGQRSLDVIRVYAEFINKPEVQPIVPMFGIANEPRGNVLGEAPLKSFYLEAYRMIREITGIGKGPAISFHTGFLDGSWDVWAGADRVMLDRHPYLVFAGPQTQAGPVSMAGSVCTSFGAFVNRTNNGFGLNSAGEWSASVNDCGLYLNDLDVPADYDVQFGAGSCGTWNRWETWTDERKEGMMHYVAAQMDSFKDYFFWTWRIGPSTRNDGRIITTQWSYELGWRNGWMPTDPRTANGECSRLGYGEQVPWDGEFEPYQTTGEGATLTPSGTGGEPWPPSSLVNVGDTSQLPVYTPTGPLPTLIAEGAPAALATFIPDMGGRGMMAPIPGCDYPDRYNANGVGIPSGCTA